VGQTAIETLERWERHGAQWRVLDLSERLAVVELMTCYGELVERLESDDRALIDWLAEHAD
jgi:hypothetical protein